MRVSTVLIGLSFGCVACAQANNYDSGTYDGYDPYTSYTTYTPPPIPSFDYEFDDDEPEYPDCTGYDCVEQQVVVTYGMDEPITDAVAIVEAFDNPQFSGSPTASSRITPFDTTPGAIGRTSLYLKPGRYYMRAYLDSDAWQDAVPQSYGGLELPGDRPVGVLGALSSPKQLDVEATRNYDEDDIDRAVFITLKHVFRDGESPFGTAAHFRLRLAYPPCAMPDGCMGITPGTNVIVRLLDGDELDASAAFESTLKIEDFQVTTRLGAAELVTQELPEEAFVVYSFMDLNANGFVDDGEPRAILGSWEAPAYVKAKANLTPTFDLTLE